jgi:GrpB-like predicted nucleotidyltransferase (UPF0157 family)
VDQEGDLTSRLGKVLVHGLQPVWVEIVDYDPRWPELYERSAARLRRRLGARLRLVEHIGSTSVPGLAAKPLIDVVAGIDDPDDEGAYLEDLRLEGFELRVTEPGHRCLRGRELDLPVNLHCYAPGSVEIERYLRFRGRLRHDEDDRRLYEHTKRTLAGREWPDMNFYAESKGPVIAEILSRS